MFGEHGVIGDYKMFLDREQRALDALSPHRFLRFLSTDNLCDSDGSDCASVKPPAACRDRTPTTVFHCLHRLGPRLPWYPPNPMFAGY